MNQLMKRLVSKKYATTKISVLTGILLIFAKNNFNESYSSVFYLLVALVITVLPFLFGYFFSGIIRLNNKLQKLSLIYAYWLYWFLGLILFNFPYVLSSVIKVSGYDLSLIFLAILNIGFIILAKTDNSFSLDYKKWIWNKYCFISLVSTIFIVLIYYGNWYQLLNWTSREFDLLQNIHLGNYFAQNNWALFGEQITPLYNITTYTTFLIPVFAFISQLFPTYKLLESVFFVEIIFIALVFITRSYFLNKTLNFSISISYLLAGLSLLLSNNSSIYPAGELINQQVILFVSLPIFSLYFDKKYILAFCFWLLCLPFHALGSFLLAIFIFCHFIFERVLKERQFYQKFYIPIWAVLYFPAILAIYASIDDNLKNLMYTTVSRLTNNSIHAQQILDRSVNWRVISLNNSFGPVVLGLFFVSCFVTVLPKLREYLWVSIYCLYCMGMTFAVLPFFNRISALTAVPIAIMIGVLIQHVLINRDNKFFKHFTLLSLILSMLSILALGYFRQFDNLASDFFTGTFFEKYEFSAINEYKNTSNFQDVLKDSTKYTFLSDYITKHVATTIFENYEEFGLYETDPTKRIATRDFLAQNRNDLCKTTDRKYVLQIISVRSLAFSRFSNTDSITQLSNVWKIKPLDQINKYSVSSFDFKYDSINILEEKEINNLKFRLLQCPK